MAGAVSRLDNLRLDSPYASVPGPRQANPGRGRRGEDSNADSNLLRGFARKSGPVGAVETKLYHPRRVVHVRPHYGPNAARAIDSGTGQESLP